VKRKRQQLRGRNEKGNERNAKERDQPKKKMRRKKK
jgi:hypothetical protein